MAADGEQKDENRLVKIDLDDAGKPRRSAEAEQERAIAIYDILEDNIFRLESEWPGHSCVHAHPVGLALPISVEDSQVYSTDTP